MLVLYWNNTYLWVGRFIHHDVCEWTENMLGMNLIQLQTVSFLPYENTTKRHHAVLLWFTCYHILLAILIYKEYNFYHFSWFFFIFCFCSCMLLKTGEYTHNFWLKSLTETIIYVCILLPLHDCMSWTEVELYSHMKFQCTHTHRDIVREIEITFHFDPFGSIFFCNSFILFCTVCFPSIFEYNHEPMFVFRTYFICVYIVLCVEFKWNTSEIRLHFLNMNVEIMSDPRA